MMTWKKLTDSGYKTLSHTLYSSDLSFTDYHFLKHLDIFLMPKQFRSKEVETAFKDFLATKLFEFYHTGINNQVKIDGKNS